MTQPAVTSSPATDPALAARAANQAAIEARKPSIGRWVDLMGDLDLVLLQLAGLGKAPVMREWQKTVARDYAAAATWLEAGSNIGVLLGPSRLIVWESDNVAGTAALRDAGLPLYTVSAGSRDPNHDHAGGVHVLWRVPAAWPADTAVSGAGTAVTLANGGKVDVLAGAHNLVLPPSVVVVNRKDGAHKPHFVGQYMSASEAGYCAPEQDGWRLADASGEIPELPLWAWPGSMMQFAGGAERTVAPAGLEPLAGVAGPKPPPVPRSGGSDDALTQEVDGLDLLGLLEAAGVPGTRVGYDRCGPCEMWLRAGSTATKSITVHDCAEHGARVQVWTTNLPGLRQGGCSRLDAYAGATGKTCGEAMAELGLRIDAGLGVVDLPRRSEVLAATPAPAAPVIGTAGVASPQLHAVPGVGDTAGAVGVPVLPPGVVPPALVAPFTRATDPGPFPVDALPEPLRSHAEWIMDAVAVPGSLVGPMYPPLLAAACGRGEIHARPGWVEHGAIWSIVVADPSARKSPVLKLITAPLQPAKAALEKATAAIRSRAAAEVTALEEALEKATSAYRNAYKASVTGGSGPVPVTPGTPLVGPAPAAVVSVRPAVDGGVLGPAPAIGSVAGAGAGAGPGGAVSGADLTGLRDAMQDLESKLTDARDRIPSRILLSFGNATDAALQRALRDCHGVGFMVVPEAGTWFEALARGDDPHSTARDYLQAHDGEPISVLREGRGEFLIDDPYLNMLLVMQPDPLRRGLAPDREGRRRLVGNGAWARLGVGYVAGCDPDDFDREIPDGGDAAEAYSAIIQREFLRSYGRRVPLRFGIDPEARILLAGIYDWVERIKVAHAALPEGASMAMEWGKAVGRCLRIARVFAQIQLTDEQLAAGGDHLIDAEALRSAWRITEWMMQSAAWAMGGAKADSEEAMLVRTIRWLRKRLAKDGPVAYRTLYGNKKFKAKSETTHRPWLIEAIEWMEDTGEVTVTPGVAISNATITPTEQLGTADLPAAV